MRIVLIVPYFGKFPSNFQQVLNSCKYNADLIDWFFYTDDRTNYNYPSNCKVFYCNLKDLRKKIQKLYSFEICLSRPYKLCDYRPAYGHIFENDIEGYDFWGHCDIDCIFGKLSNFLKPDILKYDRVFRLGHLCLYKNEKEVNRRYMLPVDNIYRYKKVFQTEENCIFDEKNVMNNLCIDNIWEKYGFSCIYYDNIIANIYYKSNKLLLLYQDNNNNYKREYMKGMLFFWYKGNLHLLYIKNNKLIKREYAYIHFMKRNMKAVGYNNYGLKIVPNKLIAIDKIPTTINEFKKEKKLFFTFQYFTSRFRNFKIKCKMKLIKRK